MKKFDKIELTAGRLVHGGKCLSSYEGKIAFIENCVPGDKVIGIVKKIKSDYIEITAEKILQSSPYRQNPICSHFGVCGGCNLQYMSYSSQLDSKKIIVEEIFNRIGKLKNVNVNDVIGSDKTIHYRNKMEYSFSDRRWLNPNDAYSEEEKKFALGLHIPNRYDKVLHLSECFLQSQLSNQIRNFVGEYFFKKGVSIYSSKNPSGYLKSLMIRESFHTEDKMINLVTTTFDERLVTELAEIIKTNFPQISTFVNNITGINVSTTIGNQIEILFGEGKIIEKLLGYEFEISSNSFFQTNTLQAEKMFMKIEEILHTKDNDILLDFYCGAGVIGIILAKYFNE
ncbi:MAG: 23S rRNA (uracil(1939)-C(5))-methyltransferase RlmD, partial [Ignavibacteria bacterium]|nr:23S rRNA (uracil(1939)-C(5))-methyltransferase RlmD [Ignavibacteria bacterium]